MKQKNFWQKDNQKKLKKKKKKPYKETKKAKHE